MITITEPQNISIISEALELLETINNEKLNTASDRTEFELRKARRKKIGSLRSCFNRAIEHKRIEFNL